MKKKLNLLWNLKFNFFSVAERPLTFFAYFLNAKKVGRRRLVIGPAKAGAFLFSHTRLPFPPRPLLPFGRISPAAKPGWPVTGPAFWVCRAKSRAAFRCAKPPWPMFWPVLFIGQKMRYSVLAGFSSISQCR